MKFILHRDPDNRSQKIPTPLSRSLSLLMPTN